MAGDRSSAIARFLLAINRPIARVVPLSLALKLPIPITDVMRAALPTKAEVARRNYAQVLGLNADDPIVEARARECFRHFGRYVAETIHMQGWSTEDLADRLEVDGEEHFAAAESVGKGAIFVSAHMGSTEVAAALAVRKGFRITSVAERMKPDFLMDYLVLSRQRMGITLLPVERAGVSLARALRRGGMVAFVVDAGIDRAGAVPVTFFGRRTPFPDGPARLARLSGAPVVFGLGVRRPGGRYRAHICAPLLSDRTLPAAKDVRALTQQIATLFEGFVRRYPGQWYAFREVWPD